MKTLFSIGTVFAGLVCSSALVAQVAPPPLDTPCVAGTLASYEGEGFNCSVGIDNFNGFRSTGGLDATNVEVTPVLAAGDGGGFQLSALNSSVFSDSTGSNVTYDVFWDLDNIDPGPQANGASLGMDPPMGNVTIIENYCTNAFFNSDGVCTAGIQSLMVKSPPCLTSAVTDPADCQATLNFSPFLDSAGVKTIIELDPANTAGTSSFDSLTGTSSNNPEPATWLLSFGGLLTIRMLRRRKV
jgi:hypothetical protein